MTLPNASDDILRLARSGLVGFEVAGHLLSIPIGFVREVNQQLDLTPVRRAPSYLRGLVNLRGQVVTVVDLGVRLGAPRREITASSRLVVLKTTAEFMDGEIADDKMGFLVDRITDIVTPSRSDLEAPPANLSARAAPYVVGVCKTRSSALGILNPKPLLSADDAVYERFAATGLPEAIAQEG
ncbi:MAG: chemotaxis protein CheW [Myxococcota bacterium]